MEKNSLDAASVIIGSLGKYWRVIFCKLGQDVGKFAISEAITDFGRPGDEREMEVIVGERMDGIDDSLILHRFTVVRFGSKGSLAT